MSRHVGRRAGARRPWLLAALATLAVATVGCGGGAPHAKFEYAIPELSARLSGANFEYVRFGATGRVDIPERRDRMKERFELGLVNEALQQIYAQAPKGQAIGLVNVVVEVSEKKVTRSVLFTETTITRSDAQLVIRADIVRFTTRLPAAEKAPPPPPSERLAPPAHPGEPAGDNAPVGMGTRSGG